MAIISKVCCDNCEAVITSENGGYLITGKIKVAPVDIHGNYAHLNDKILINEKEGIKQGEYCVPCFMGLLNLK